MAFHTVQLQQQQQQQQHQDEAHHGHFQPWLLTDSIKDAVLPVDPEHYAAFDGIRLTPPPEDAKQTFAAVDWAPFNTYCSSSPSGSSPYSSSDSRTFSDMPSATWASPDLSLCYSSGQPSPDILTGSFDGTIAQSIELGPFGSCSLSEVQQFAEPESDMLAFDSFHQHNALAGFPVYQQHMPVAPTIEPIHAHYSYESSPAPHWQVDRTRENSLAADYEYLSVSSADRGRTSRKHSSSVSSAFNNPTKIHKRGLSTTPSRRFSTPLSTSYSKSCSPSRFSRATPSASNSNFPCPLAPYGCTSSFGSKNEWKRHVNTQHLRLDLWRCDQCNDRETRPNDFNRKDLFIQHLRRMHHKPGSCSSAPTTEARSARARSVCPGAEETDPAIAAAEQRCHIRLRQPPSHSCCLFCNAEFDGPGSWEERMEHVGRHLEQDKKEGREAPAVEGWRVDADFEHWLESEGLIARVGYEWTIADGRRFSR